MAGSRKSVRNRRLEVRTTEDERALIDKAVHAAEVDMSTFVVTNIVEEARRVLADRERFVLTERAQAEWERINAQPAEELDGLRRLLQRPSPFMK